MYGQIDHIPLPDLTTRSGRAFWSLLKQTIHVCAEGDNDQPNSNVCAKVYDHGGQVQSALAATLLAATVDTSPECPALTECSSLPGQDLELDLNLVPVGTSTESVLPLKRSVTFDEQRVVRLYSPDSLVIEHRDFTQVCANISKHLSTLKPTTYLMANCASIDHSLKEVFYQSFFTSPLANKLALIKEEDDFTY